MNWTAVGRTLASLAVVSLVLSQFYAPYTEVRRTRQIEAASRRAADEAGRLIAHPAQLRGWPRRTTPHDTTDGLPGLATITWEQTSDDGSLIRLTRIDASPQAWRAELHPAFYRSVAEHLTEIGVYGGPGLYLYHRVESGPLRGYYLDSLILRRPATTTVLYSRAYVEAAARGLAPISDADRIEADGSLRTLHEFILKRPAFCALDGVNCSP